MAAGSVYTQVFRVVRDGGMPSAVLRSGPTADALITYTGARPGEEMHVQLHVIVRPALANGRHHDLGEEPERESTPTATAPIPAPSSPATADPQLLDVLQDLACAVRGLRGSVDAVAVARAEQLGVSWELRRVPDTAPTTTATTATPARTAPAVAPAPAPAPPTTPATTRARTTATPTSPARKPRSAKASKPPRPAGVHACVRPDSRGSRVVRAVATFTGPMRVDDILAVLGVAGAAGAAHRKWGVDVCQQAALGYLRRVSPGVYELTQKGRSFAVALEELAQAEV